MVTTRSGKDHDLVHAIALSKAMHLITKTNIKKLVRPSSRAKQTLAAPTSPVVVRRPSGGKRKAPSTVKPKTKQAPAEAEADTGHGDLSISLITQHAANLVLDNANIIAQRKTPDITETFTRETDTAWNASVVIKMGGVRQPAFNLVQTGYTKEYSKGFFSNSEKYKVGEHPFITWLGPKQSAYTEVFDVLKEYHEAHRNLKKGEVDEEGQQVLKFELSDNYLVPGHAYEGTSHQFQALIEPMISCATSNNNQKMAADSLKANLSYQNGEEGSTPNWHRLTDISEYELSTILRSGGRNKKNAEHIMSLFYAIMGVNIQEKQLSYEESKRIHEEAKGAADWTDGLLSLNFLVGLDMQQMFDKLVTFKGLGTKSVACIMCFSFNFAMFAVDTHIFRLAQWLGWVPRGCTVKDAFKFLTLAIPPKYHKSLHQVKWHHARDCYRCSEKTWYKVNDPQWKECVCPLEPFIAHRFPDWDESKPKKSNEQQISREIKIHLKTEEDVADAEAAGHMVLEIRDKDAAEEKSTKISRQNFLKARSEELSKGYLVLTRAEANAFKKFQRLAGKARDPHGKVRVALNTDKDVADAIAAGFQVRAIEIDDSFGAQPELSNIEKKKKQVVDITNAEQKAFLEFQKQQKFVALALKARDIKATDKKRGLKQTTLTSLPVVKVQRTTTTRRKQITMLEFTNTTRTRAQVASKERETDEEMVDEDTMDAE